MTGDHAAEPGTHSPLPTPTPPLGHLEALTAIDIMSLYMCRWAALATAAVLSGQALAEGGALGIDHRLQRDESGIWARSNQIAVETVAAAAVMGGALWEGSDTRLGKTFWKATESMAIADVSAEGLKRLTRRARPAEGNDPNDWFRTGHGYKSFPSGEVTHIAAREAPFIVEFGDDHPAVWGLAALPVYVGAARMKSQAHWQTDVLAGAALGAAVGYCESTRDSAWTATVLPRGLTIGFKKQF